MAKAPIKLQYIKLRKEVIDIIEVQVAETTGQLLEFGKGNTIVTLQFKKEKWEGEGSLDSDPAINLEVSLQMSSKVW